MSVPLRWMYFGRHWYRDTIVLSPLHSGRSATLCLKLLCNLKYSVMRLERFVGSPGLSIHAIVAVHDALDDRGNYILDIGHERNQNRISLFTDIQGELTLSVYDGDGRRHIVRGGKEGCAYRRGVPEYLCCEIGRQADDLLVSIVAGEWNYCGVYHVDATWSPPSLHASVFASDQTGTMPSNIGLGEQVVYDRVMNESEKANSACT